ncbi:Mediator of RNA polymerase II transcription subunit 10 [Cyphellophora attinorum]|uniref:Mediator of RNA polymerase II transcription subunit 10 n=1 Tax=Cyphellophora attinorum TaxID=1664694 RepID=A0A0N1P1F0_9EURO|nr:Mediator of RNA polymerase II transcription subunit 10 [Phialophora attinorum]KPI44754.1 Mediator of RNA polymerase II transcription subunit 10 [Phialophora attinorum]
MPPKKRRRKAPTGAHVAQPKPKGKAKPKYHALTSTNGNRLTVISYPPDPPLGRAWEYEIVKPRVHNAFLALRVPPERLRPFLEKYGPGSGQGVAGAESADRAENSEYLDSGHEDTQQGDSNDSPDFARLVETPESLRQEAATHPDDSPATHTASGTVEGTQRRDSVLEPGEIREDSNFSAASSTARSPRSKVVSLRLPKSYYRHTGQPSVESPEAPDFSPITPFGYEGFTPLGHAGEGSPSDDVAQVGNEVEVPKSPIAEVHAEPVSPAQVEVSQDRAVQIESEVTITAPSLVQLTNEKDVFSVHEEVSANTEAASPRNQTLRIENEFSTSLPELVPETEAEHLPFVQEQVSQNNLDQIDDETFTAAPSSIPETKEGYLPSVHEEVPASGSENQLARPESETSAAAAAAQHLVADFEVALVPSVQEAAVSAKAAETNPKNQVTQVENERSQDIVAPGLEPERKTEHILAVQERPSQDREDERVEVGVARGLPVTAHHSFVTLGFSQRRSEFINHSLSHPASVPYSSSRTRHTLPITAHHSYVTLKYNKRRASVLEQSPKRPKRRGSAKPSGTPSRGTRNNSVATPTRRNTRAHSAIPDLPPPPTMGSVKDPNDVSTVIKDVVDNLYDVQSKTHGYIPETQDLLVERLTDLTTSLTQLRDLTNRQKTPSNPIHDVRIPPEIVDYVDEGRNPDIFTRDFVENVQRGNAVVNGKKQAFRDFSVIFAQKLKEGIKGVDQHVDRIMEQAGLEKELEEAMRKTNDQKAANANGDSKVDVVMLENGQGK